MASKQHVKTRGPSAERNEPVATSSALDLARSTQIARLFLPVDITPLVYFRVVFGVVMLCLGWQYFHGFDEVSGAPYNLIKYHYLDPKFHFTYYGFDWVKPWPGNGLYIHCYVLGIAATLIAIGLFYRAAAAVFCLGFTYLFLLDQARYLHHYYLVCLLSLLLVFLPAHRKFSLDALLRPKLRAQTAPAWTLWLLRLQFAVVYFYAGVAKCTSDWLHGEPVRTMLAYKQHRFSDAGFLTQFFTDEWFVGLIAYGGLLFDLLVVPLLLFRKTRWIGFAGMVLFHLANTQLFDIDIFPWLMLGSTFILFFPDKLPFGTTRDPRGLVGEDALAGRITPLSSGQKWTGLLVLAYCFMQIVLPLRPLLYSGDTNWSDEGRKFSWRMLSRDLRVAEPPRFFVRYQKNGRIINEEFPFPKDLSFWQHHPQFSKMLKNADLLLHFIHLQAEQMGQNGAKDIEVRVSLKMSLNGRKPQDYIDPKVNLANEPRRLFTPYPWILPLTEPLPDRKVADAPSSEAQPSVEEFE